MTEAERVLTDGGRLIMIEPAITPLSYFFYKFLHQEPVKLGWSPKWDCKPDVDKDPYDSNQAIPTLLFGRYSKSIFNKSNLSLEIKKKEWISTFVYPLSGGFKPWNLIPEFSLKRLLIIDGFLSKYLGFLLGFRLLVVLEK